MQPVIGLEIHLQLKTKTKLFCRCLNQWENERPNVNICPICLGQPGVLPVLNQAAVESAIKLGLAIHGQVQQKFSFDRKNYFYPDLPKGYQITQYFEPIIRGGYLEIRLNNQIKKIRINRLNLEEDAAKLIHAPNKDWTLIDFNRAGVPLLEIVTEPDFNSPAEAKAFLQELQILVRYLGIASAEMEKGEMRCDVNISLRRIVDQGKLVQKNSIGQHHLQESASFGAKVEIKNLSSFRSVERALEYEINRQKKLLEQGKIIIQETRGWDEINEVTVEQRSKEEAFDYRYFPEPDLPMFFLNEKEIQRIKTFLGESPQAKFERFVKIYEFNPAEAKILTTDRELANFTEKIISELKAWLRTLETVEGSEEEIWLKNKKRLVRLVANWVVNRLIFLIKKTRISIAELKIKPHEFAEFIILVYQNKIPSNIAQKVLEKMFETGVDPDSILQEFNSMIKDEKDLEVIIDEIILTNERVVADYKNGKLTAIKYLIGQVIKRSKGLADPKVVEKILEKKLNA
jgi:aspartyl-tRNA(Asn)/glutamyl-tRNA(Gln) amidotransferase subunit B